MKSSIQHSIFLILFSLFFTACEVGITPLEQKFNEAGVETTGTVSEEGDIGTITVEVQEGVNIEDLNVTIEIFGEGSEHFTVEMDKSAAGYVGEITVKPDFIVYKDTAFTFQARTIVNGQKLCAKEVQKTVLKTEVAPVADDLDIVVSVNESKTFVLKASDKNEDTLTYILKSEPLHGEVTGSGASLIYTPNADYIGIDSFTYVTKDERSESNVARVNISINTSNSDTTAPYITLLGGNPVIIQQSDLIYIDAGATATDDVDGDITANITIVNPVNLGIRGDYIITYDVNDSAGNQATQVTRTVHVVEMNDTIAPVITLVTAIAGLTNNNTPSYTFHTTEAGTVRYTGSCGFAEDIANVGNNTVTFGVISSTPLVDDTYTDCKISVKDNTNNFSNELSISSFTIDTVSPEITLIGANPFHFTVGDIFNDPGITASGHAESGANYHDLNISKVGTYTITYYAWDDAGNTIGVDRTVIIHPSTPSFTLIGITPYYSGANIGWLELIDMDRDGDLDILIKVHQNGKWKIDWFKNRGDGDYEKYRVVGTSSEVRAVHAADINGDGYTDILYAKDKLHYCINDKNGTFTCVVNPFGQADNLNITDIKTADIDNNTLVDIIFSAYDDDKVYALKQQLNFNFDSSISLTSPVGGTGGIGSLSVGDINGNGNIDIITEGSDYGVRIYAGNGTGNFVYISEEEINLVSTSIALVDFNGTGKHDFIIGTGSNEIEGYHFNGGAIEIDNLLTNPTYASGIDIDGDGKTDILSSSSETDGQIIWYQNNSNGFTKHNIAEINNSTITQAGDMDGDGDMDVVAGNEEGKIFIYLNNKPVNIVPVLKVGDRSSDFNRTGYIVEDRVTGLMWYDDLNDDAYDWSGSIGFCANKESEGYLDWRLPSIEELMTIVDKNKTSGGHKQSIFSNMHNSIHWTSTETIDGSSYAWALAFNDVGNDIYNKDKTNNARIRCVRGKKLSPATLIRNDDSNTVIDKQHGLEWMDDNITVKNSVRWSDAAQSCSDSVYNGKTDWSLPSINDLYFLADRSKKGTALPFAFKYHGEVNNGKLDYWSDTGIQDYEDVFYYLNFVHGNDHLVQVDMYYRCVRKIN